MQKKIAAFDQNADQIISLIEDAHELTAKELELERKAKLDELEKRNWMSLSAQQLTDRIPVSVLAMGDLATAR